MYAFAAAIRFLRSRRISLVAVLMVAAVTLLYLLIISVLEGFTEHYMVQLRNVMAHVTVNVGQTPNGIVYPEKWADELAKSSPEIKGVTIGLEVPAMAILDSARTVGTLRGIDLNRELQYGKLGEALNPADVKEFGSHEQGGKKLPGCIIGGSWRKNYNLKIGGRATFLFTDNDDNPRSVAFEIVAFFEGKEEYLEQAAYVDRTVLAEKLKNENGAKTLMIWMHNPDSPGMPALKQKIKETMTTVIRRDFPPTAKYDHAAGLDVQTWQEMNGNLYDANMRENNIMRFIMSIFLAMTAFTLYLIFSQMVSEKTRDIGTLRALGATPAGIQGCFLIQGFAVGLFGLLIGLIGAYFFITNVNGIAHFCGVDVFPKISFGVDKIPVKTLPGDVIAICVMTMLISLLGVLHPSWRASRLDPVECLRSE